MDNRKFCMKKLQDLLDRIESHSVEVQSIEYISGVEHLPTNGNYVQSTFSGDNALVIRYKYKDQKEKCLDKLDSKA